MSAVPSNRVTAWDCATRWSLDTLRRAASASIQAVAKAKTSNALKSRLNFAMPGMISMFAGFKAGFAQVYLELDSICPEHFVPLDTARISAAIMHAVCQD
jgi:hypothetical protein